MALNRARALFDGNLVGVSMSMAVTPGIVPDNGTIVYATNTTQPSNNIGDLVLQWGNDTDGWSTVRTWVDCHLARADRQKKRYDDIVYTVRDRRWRWQHRYINGVYNVRDEKDSLITATQKTPQELATLLLEALGESSFDVTAFSTVADDAPAVQWLYANAATELSKLAQRFGLDVHLLSDNTVKMVQRGTGTVPGTTNLIEPVQATLALEQPPETIRAYCSATEFESWLKLTPCAPELDGTVEDLDDLSFMPLAGWERTDPVAFLDVNGATDAETTRLREHCKRYIWRMFRVSGFAGGATKPPGYDADEGGSLPAVTNMKLLAPFQPNRLQTGLDENGKYRRLPAELAGSFSQLDTIDPHSVPKYTLWTDGFRIDGNNGYVYTNRPCYRLPIPVHTYANSAARIAFTGYTPTQEDFDSKSLFVDADTLNYWRIAAYNPSGPIVTWESAVESISPPILALRCAYGLREANYGNRYHHGYDHTTGATNGSGDAAIRVPWTNRIVIEEYTSDYSDLAATGTEFDNKTAVEAILQAAAEAEALNYLPTLQPQTGRYHTPFTIDTDGKVQQVSYSAGAELEFVQTVSVNFEHVRNQLPRDEEMRARTARNELKQDLSEFGQKQLLRAAEQAVAFPMHMIPVV